jgi:hypothetical protein
MSELVWSEFCVPAVTGASRDSAYSECCSARFEFSYTAGRGNGLNNSNYFPNECSASPRLDVINIGPMIVDMEVISGGILVDDELLIDGSIYEPGTELRVLAAEQKNGTGVPFTGGLSVCNGQHTVAEGKVLTVVPQGGSVTLGFGDNHGIELILNGSIILKPLQAP